MAKILNFTVVEILPALLDKSKTQTIRPAWKLLKGKTKVDTQRLLRYWQRRNAKIIEVSKEPYKYFIIEKPPRFKVGDKVKLLWNQRSRNQHFCKKCGKGYPCKQHNKEAGIFNKHLGNAEITEVFKIEMYVSERMKKSFLIEKPYLHFGYKETKDWGKFRIKLISGKKLLGKTKDLAKLDGFKSAEDMLNYFDKKYDLSQPKAFWVYRWKWLK